jgi:hypothetical protein
MQQDVVTVGEAQRVEVGDKARKQLGRQRRRPAARQARDAAGEAAARGDVEDHQKQISQLVSRVRSEPNCGRRRRQSAAGGRRAVS